MGVFIAGLKGSHSHMLAPLRHSHTMRWRAPFLGFPGLQQLNFPSLWNAEHSVFHLLREVCCDRGQHTSHQGCAYHGNCFSCKEWIVPVSGPKKTKYLQAFLEMHQAFLSTVPNLGWDLKTTTANQSVKFIDVEFLCFATGWILSRTIPCVGGESKPREREERKWDIGKVSLH